MKNLTAYKNFRLKVLLDDVLEQTFIKLVFYSCTRKFLKHELLNPLKHKTK